MYLPINIVNFIISFMSQLIFESRHNMTEKHKLFIV